MAKKKKVAKKVVKVDESKLAVTEGENSSASQVIPEAPVSTAKKGDSPAVVVAKEKAAAIIEEAVKNDKDQKDLEKDFKKSDIVIFVSRYKEHCLCMESKVIKEGKTGNNEIVSKGKKLQFHNCLYRTSDEAEIKFIKSHPAFGATITLATTSPEAVKEAVNERIKTQMQ